MAAAAARLAIVALRETPAQRTCAGGLKAGRRKGADPACRPRIIQRAPLNWHPRSPSTVPATAPEVVTMMQLWSTLVASTRTCGTGSRQGTLRGWRGEGRVPGLGVWSGACCRWWAQLRVMCPSICAHLRAGAPGWLPAAHAHVAAQVEQGEGGEPRPGARDGALQGGWQATDGHHSSAAIMSGRMCALGTTTNGHNACTRSNKATYRPPCSWHPCGTARPQNSPRLTPRLLLASCASCRLVRSFQASGRPPDR